jgi:hypothetical protein
MVSSFRHIDKPEAHASTSSVAVLVPLVLGGFPSMAKDLKLIRNVEIIKVYAILEASDSPMQNDRI